MNWLNVEQCSTPLQAILMFEFQDEIEAETETESNENVHLFRNRCLYKPLAGWLTSLLTGM